MANPEPEFLPVVAARYASVVASGGMDYPNQEILCKGVITKKYEEDGEHIVDLDIWTETGAADDDDDRPKNEVGLKTTPGSAKVALPVRG